MNKYRPDQVRVACISDTHCNAQNIPGGIPECDILIHAGDITAQGRPERFLEFNEWGNHIPLPPERKICTPGNHDLLFEEDYETAVVLVDGWTVLVDEEVTVKGLKIYGTPWSVEFGHGWAFNQNSAEAKQRWAKIPLDTDILVVHGPPQGTGDLCPNGYQGCPDLEDRLRIVKPRLVVCGHIHEGYGVHSTSWGGLLVNASTMTGNYRPINPAITVTIPLYKD